MSLSPNPPIKGIYLLSLSKPLLSLVPQISNLAVTMSSGGAAPTRKEIKVALMDAGLTKVDNDILSKCKRHYSERRWGMERVMLHCLDAKFRNNCLFAAYAHRASHITMSFL